jgi:DNA-binding transcriptional LysR family regulator
MPGAPWTANTEPIAAGLLPVAIRRLSRRYPRLAIYVSQSPIAMPQQSIPQFANLRERKVDLVFGPVVRRAADDDRETGAPVRRGSACGGAHSPSVPAPPQKRMKEPST